MTPETVLTRNPGAAYRVYDGQATIVLPDTARVMVLNGTASLVWDKIDGRRTLDQIVQAVVEAYDINLDQARQDVLEFAASLQENGMVT